MHFTFLFTNRLGIASLQYICIPEIITLNKGIVILTISQHLEFHFQYHSYSLDAVYVHCVSIDILKSSICAGITFPVLEEHFSCLPPHQMDLSHFVFTINNKVSLCFRSLWDFIESMTGIGMEDAVCVFLPSVLVIM